MMTDREKLVKLLDYISYGQEFSCYDLYDMSDAAESIADFLITKGVTVREWISVEDRLPEDDQPVLCWYEYFRFGNYNRMYQTYGIGYCINGYWSGEVSQGQKCRVLAWMPLPKPPKEGTL